VISGRVAAVDIGTNTVRLLVAEVRRPGLPGHGSLFDLDRRVEVVRLGQGVDATGRLADDAIGRTIAMLETYGAAIRSWRPDVVRVVATSASRDASNRDVFLDAAELALGTRPVVISGDREADLAFAGVLAAFQPDRDTVVVDLGGGSTEFVFGRASVDYAVSVDIGSVRLTERILGEGPHDAAALEAARSHVDALLDDVDLPALPGRTVGVAGTFTSLAALALELEVYDSDQVDGARLGHDRLVELVDRLGAMTSDAIAALGPIDARRAGVLTAGAIVAERAVAATGRTEVIVSESDLLDGIALWAAGLTG
jgi:exopolyphosphatase/guanosine-5'-triphosphate,3'-diphosphate pyrophosphatase